MTQAKKPADSAASHRVRMTIRYEPEGYADVAALLEKIRKWRPATLLDKETSEAPNGTARGVCTAYLQCRDADSLVRKLKSGLLLETAITRISMHIRYGLDPAAPQSFVNLLA